MRWGFPSISKVPLANIITQPSKLTIPSGQAFVLSLAHNNIGYRSLNSHLPSGHHSLNETLCDYNPFRTTIPVISNHAVKYGAIIASIWKHFYFLQSSVISKGFLYRFFSFKGFFLSSVYSSQRKYLFHCLLH